MDTLLEVIKRAFDDGCDRTFDEVIADPAVQWSLKKRHLDHTDFESGSDNEKAYRSGAVEFGAWLSGAGEQAALELARPRRTAVMAEAEALIEVLGQDLTKTSLRVLPPGVAEAAQAWQEADAAGQLELARAYAASIRAAVPPKPKPVQPDIHQDDDLGSRSLSYEFVNASFAPMDIGKVLPKSFRAWTGEDVPNCLGMALCTAAFAELCGARYMAVALIDDSHSYTWANNARWYGVMAEQAKLHDPDGVSTIKSMTSAALERDRKQALAVSGRIDDFHFAITMKRADGSWILVDPYLRSVAALNDAYEAESVYETLGRYALALPGLTVTRDDGGALKRYLDGSDDEIQKGIAHSETLRGLADELPVAVQGITRLRDNEDGSELRTHYYGPYHLYELVDRISETDAIDWCIRMSADDPCCNYDAKWTVLDQICEDMRRKDYDSSPMLKLVEEAHRLEEFFENYAYVTHEAFDYEVDLDRKLCRRIADLTLAMAIRNGLLASGRAEADFPHPALEFMRPGYGLALAVVNQLRCWTENQLDGKVMTALSSSQMYWHDAVDLSNGLDPDDPEIRAIEETVRQLPHLHPAVSNKLAYLGRLRSEG